MTDRMRALHARCARGVASGVALLALLPCLSVGAQPLHGVMRARSSLPDPAQSPYADALFSAGFEIAPGGENIIAVFTGFTNRVPAEAAALQPGDLLRLEAVPFEQAPARVQATRLCDDIGELTLPVWYVESFRRLETLPAEARSLPVPAEAAPAANLPSRSPSPAEEQARTAAMQAAIARIEGRLRARGGDWDAWFHALEPQRGALRERLAAANGPLFGPRLSLPGLDALTSRFDPASAEAANLVRFFREMSRYWRDRGAHLIVAPFPDRDAVAAPFFLDTPPADGELNPCRLRLIHTLLTNDVEVLDLFPAFLEAARGPGLMYLYDTPDWHPAEGAVVTAGALLARTLRDRYDLPWGEATGLRLDPRPHEAELDPYPGVAVPWPKTVDYVLDADGRIAALDDGSPVLFFGDCFARTPPAVNGDGAALPWQFLRASGLRPALFVRNMSAPRMLRQLVRFDSIVNRRRKVAIFLTSFSNLALRPGEWEWIDTRAEAAGRDEFARLWPAGRTLQRFVREADFASLQWSPDGGPPGRWVDGRFQIEPALLPRRVTLPGHRLRPGVACALYLTGKAAAAQTWMFDNGAGERQALHLVHQQNAVGIVFRTAAPFRPPFIEIPGNQADFWFRELVIRELPEEASAPAPPSARE